MVEPRHARLIAFGAYPLLAFLFFGLGPLIEPGRQYIGVFDDPQIPIWSFAWWLHAIEHAREPVRHPRRLGAGGAQPRLGEHGAGALGRVRAADGAPRAGARRTTSPRCCCRRSRRGRPSCSAVT